MGLEPSNRLWLPDSCQFSAVYERFFSKSWMALMATVERYVQKSCIKKYRDHTQLLTEVSKIGTPACDGAFERKLSRSFQHTTEQSTSRHVLRQFGSNTIKHWEKGTTENCSFSCIRLDSDAAIMLRQSLCKLPTPCQFLAAPC